MIDNDISDLIREAENQLRPYGHASSPSGTRWLADHAPDERLLYAHIGPRVWGMIGADSSGRGPCSGSRRWKMIERPGWN
jgi:hypothetical protein